MAVMQDITTTALQRVNDTYDIAVELKDDSLERMNALAAAAESHLNDLNALSYSPNFGGLSTQYTAPAIVSAEPTITDMPDVPDLNAEESLLGDGPTAPTLHAEGGSLFSEPSAPTLNAEATLAPLSNKPIVPSLSTFAGVSAFAYTNTAYSAQLKTAISGLLAATLGGTGLLTNDEYTAIWDRAEADLTRQQVAAEWEAADVGARLGWTLPSEATLVKLDMVDEQTVRGQAAARLSQSVTEATQRREDKKAAVVDGTQFENVWIDEHNKGESRKLEAATQLTTQALSINAGLVAQDTLKMRAFEVVWAGIKTEVDALLGQDDAKLKKFSTLWTGVQVKVAALMSQDAALLAKYDSVWKTIKLQADVLVAQDDIKLRLFGERWRGIQLRVQSISEMWKARMMPAAQAIASEQARQPFEALTLEKGIKVADGETDYWVKREQVVLSQTLGVLTSIAQMISGLTQAALAASDIRVGTGADWNYGESHSYCEKACT